MSVMDLYGIACEGVEAPLPADKLGGNEPVDCIIVQEGWGNSGYYGREMMKAAVEADVFAPNTRSFLGHPKSGEEEPAAGTIGHIAGKARFVESDPEAGGKPTIRAPYQAFSDRRAWLAERAKAGAVALSLRAPINYKMATAEGKYGRVATSFAGPAWSVDVVARPGAGGKFGVFTESARPGQVEENEKEGSDMPLSKEETAEIVKASAIAAVEALAPTLTGITDALGKITTAQESVAPKALPARELSAMVSKAKLHQAAESRVYDAIEAAKPEEVTTAFVDKLIATEAAYITEATALVTESLTKGTIEFADGKLIEGKGSAEANESEVVVAGWFPKEVTK